MMPIRRGPQQVPRSGPERAALAARLAAEHAAGAGTAELMALGGCGRDDLDALLAEAVAARRTATP